MFGTLSKSEVREEKSNVGGDDPVDIFYKLFLENMEEMVRS